MHEIKRCFQCFAASIFVNRVGTILLTIKDLLIIKYCTKVSFHSPVHMVISLHRKPTREEKSEQMLDCRHELENMEAEMKRIQQKVCSQRKDSEWCKE